MARQSISLVSDDVKKKSLFRYQIENGQIAPTDYSAMSADDQATVNDVLWSIAAEKSDPVAAVSALEFILFSFIRITNLKLAGTTLSTEDQAVETSLNQILQLHDITNGTLKANWLFDYLAYADAKAQEFLQDRKDHVDLKKSVTGTV